MNNNKSEKQEKIKKYVQMIDKLNTIKKEMNEHCYQYKRVKEIIDEYETNNLIYFNDFNQIKSKQIN